MSVTRHSTAVAATLNFFILLSTAYVAEAAPEPALDELVITATRSEMPVERLNVPVIVIDRAEIEQSQAGDVAELLAGRAGIEIARNGGAGQPASIFMRGTESNHTAVLIDGVRINPGTIGGAALQNILPESIERIEIVKGARSTLYGSDAIGGVINLITRAGSARGATASVAASRYDTQQYALDGGVQWTDNLAMGANLAYRSTAGFPPQSGATQPRGHDNRSGNLQLQLLASDALTLRAQLWRAQGNSEYLGYDAFFSFGPLDQDYRNDVQALAVDYHPGWFRFKANLNQAEDFIDQNQSDDFAHTRRRTLDTQFSWQVADFHQLSIGLVGSREATAAASFGTAFDVGTDVLLAYLQDQLRFGANELLLAAGRTDHETFGLHHTWNAEYGRALGDDWRVTIAAGTAFHAPDSTDRFGYGGNPALQPERSRQYELGLRWSPGREQQLQLSAFDNHIDSLILFELVDPANFVYRNQNVERARIRGIEASYQRQWASWQFRTSATFQDPRNLTTDAPLLRRARQHFQLRLQREQGPLLLAGELLISGARYDSSFPDVVRLPGYALLNLSAAYRLAPQWLLQFRLDNALDRAYTLVNGYNTPRRSVTIATRYQLR